MADLYADLGLAADASPEEIKAAHRRMVKSTHPDAGGSREAFDRVQLAHNILSDHSRRQRYDETGATSEVDPMQLARAQAMSTVAGKMNVLISDPAVDPRSYDLVLGIRELITEERRTAEASIRESSMMQARLRQFERRLKRKKGLAGGDAITPMISSQIAAHSQRILAIQDAIKVLAMAAELVEEYVYETDPAQQMRTVNGPQGWVFPQG